MTFQLDTTGNVYDNRIGNVAGKALTRWSDLSPFAQGYIEALFASIGGKLEIVPFMGMRPEPFAVGFSDLAPETLARIIADCEARAWLDTDGKWFWISRQNGNLDAFPPLTVQLGDDGKVRFAA